MAELTQLANGAANKISSILNLDSRHQFERDAAFVTILGACLFLVIALASFQPLDNWIYSSASDASSKNLTGPAGNGIAGLLIFYMGLTAATLPVLMTQIAWHVRAGVMKQSIIPTITGWLTLLMSLMPILSSVQPTLSIRQVGFACGGALGNAFLLALRDTTGAVGSQIVLWSALGASLILISRVELAEIVNFLRQRKNAAKENPSKSKILDTKTESERDPDITTSQIFEPLAKEVISSSSTNTSADVIFEPLENPLPEEMNSHLPDDFAPQRPYAAPPLETFKRSDERNSFALSQKELEATGAVLTKTLSEFGVEGKIIGWQPGPVVTVYEYQPDAGIKQSKIISLMDDLALSLKVDSIFINPVPGKRALGIQVPNQRREVVFLGDVIASESFQKNPSPMTFAMGKTINGQPFTADLTTMPHLLAAGATGTGKSVGINSLLCSVIMKSSPEDVRMILVDPKMLELSVYDGIPHLLMPVITEPDRASSALKWAANEMERRYKIMQHAQVRNIGGFNAFWESTSESRREQIKGLMNDPHIARLPYILLVIDELADLMLTAPKDVEGSIQRLAQKARASGIHMVLATQRPSVDVITGVIKANLPCRLSFQVVSKHDSRTILDQMGAEKLLGRGDLLLQRPGVGRLERLQGALVSDEEVLALVAQTKKNYDVIYDERAMGWIDEEVTRASGVDDSNDGSGAAAAAGDPKWEDALNIARTHGVISASFLQRHLQIGYNRAARIVEGMELKGLVAKADGSKPRKWLGGL
jgi:S-DNA-T family DNA segregation ATPase FtsK/SpoIIIE